MLSSWDSTCGCTIFLSLSSAYAPKLSSAGRGVMFREREDVADSASSPGTQLPADWKVRSTTRGDGEQASLLPLNIGPAVPSPSVPKLQSARGLHN